MPHPARLQLGDRLVDLSTGAVGGDGVEEQLAPKERDLLAYLAERAGETVSRDELLARVWGYADTAVTRTVDTTVRRLRQKIEANATSPVHLVTVHGAGYRLELTSPAVEPARRTNVGPDTTSFVGRESELAALRARLEAGARLLVLLGPAGAGKTRLALRCAQRAPDTFPGGIWFADLTEARSREGLVAAVARALEIPLAAGAEDGLVAIGHALSGRGRALLVLDNAEQIVDEVAAASRAWLAASDAVLLVTSRERLRLVEEVAFEVEPLGEDDAVRLFVERASAVRAGFVPRDEDGPTLRAIARRLEGLPLAIELAAARAGLLAPAELLARLSEGLLAAAGSRRDPTGRQATLQGALEWSWALLEPWERAALATTAVFRGGFALDAFEAIVDLSPWPEAPAAMDVLHDLVDQSLVRARHLDAGTRFGTYEYVRAFAEGKLDAPEPARARHRAWYLALGERLASACSRHGGIAAMTRLSHEIDNLIAVSDTAPDPLDRARAVLALDPLLYVRGPHALHHALLDQAARDLGALPASWRARLLRARGDARRQQARVAEAAVDLDGALACARETADPSLIAEVLTTRGLFHVEGGRTDAAEADLIEARALAAGDRGTEGLALSYLGIVAQWRGRLDESESLLREARVALREVGDRAREGNVATNLGIIALAHQRHDEASALFEEALAIAREAGSRRREAIVLVNVASVHFAAGRLSAAEQAFASAHALHLDVGQRRDAAIALGNLGWLALEQGRRDEARERLERAARLHAEVGNRRTEGITLGNLGVLHHTHDDPAAARACYDRALAVLREFDDRRAWSHFLAWSAALQAEGGQLEQAEAAFDEAASLLGEAADPVARAMVEVLRGSLDLARGERAAAEARLEAAIPVAERSAEVRWALRHLREALAPQLSHL